MTLDENIINPFVQLVHPKRKYLPQFFYEEEMEALFKTVEETLQKVYGIELFLNCYRLQVSVFRN